MDVPSALRSDACTEAATTAMVLTSAKPIINADAVDAVRRGVRCAFLLAMRPGVLRFIDKPGRGNRLLTIRLTGAATDCDKLATPRKIINAPIADAARMPTVPPG